MDGNNATAGGCPVMHGTNPNVRHKARSNREWWPNQLNLRILHQNTDLPMHIIARPVRAGQLASVLDAEIRQGDALVAVARALFSGAPAERGITHRFDQSDELC